MGDEALRARIGEFRNPGQAGETGSPIPLAPGVVALIDEFSVGAHDVDRDLKLGVKPRHDRDIYLGMSALLRDASGGGGQGALLVLSPSLLPGGSYAESRVSV